MVPDASPAPWSTPFGGQRWACSSPPQVLAWELAAAELKGMGRPGRAPASLGAPRPGPFVTSGPRASACSLLVDTVHGGWIGCSRVSSSSTAIKVYVPTFPRLGRARRPVSRWVGGTARSSPSDSSRAPPRAWLSPLRRSRFCTAHHSVLGPAWWPSRKHGDCACARRSGRPPASSWVGLLLLLRPQLTPGPEGSGPWV